MSLVPPLVVRSLMRVMGPLVHRPVASLWTILYFSGVLPRDQSLERFVRGDLVPNNYLFLFLINMLRCFW